nr:hypothetical protein [uncultured Oscillibacter sp.]
MKPKIPAFEVPNKKAAGPDLDWPLERLPCKHKALRIAALLLCGGHVDCNIARREGAAGIFDLCDILPKTFDLTGFLPFSVSTNVNGDSASHESEWLLSSPWLLRAVHSGFTSVATKHSEHDRFVAFCGVYPFLPVCALS